MRKVISHVLLLWLCFLVSPAARERGSARTRRRPIPERFAKVRAMILEALQKSGAPSISIAAAKTGESSGRRASAMRQGKKIRRLPIRLCAGLHIQVLHRTGLMVLAERKLVDLDRPVNDYLDEAKLTVYAGDARKSPSGGAPYGSRMRCTGTSMMLPRQLALLQDESIRRYGIVVNGQVGSMSTRISPTASRSHHLSRLRQGILPSCGRGLRAAGLSGRRCISLPTWLPCGSKL